jgi:ribosomal protein L29
MIVDQIKPLTEEEKKAKLADLRQKLAEKRAVQAKDDGKAQKANEVSIKRSLAVFATADLLFRH